MIEVVFAFTWTVDENLQIWGTVAAIGLLKALTIWFSTAAVSHTLCLGPRSRFLSSLPGLCS
jgi:hypothetical protein